MLTVAEIFDVIAEHRGAVVPLRNEATGQRGVCVKITKYGREHSFESWFLTDLLNASNGPVVSALRQVAEMLVGYQTNGAATNGKCDHCGH